MKILKANKIPEKIKLKTELIDVKGLRLLPPEKWLNKRIDIYNYEDNFSKNGMQYPICVVSSKEEWANLRIRKGMNKEHIDKFNNVIDGLYVFCGNKRVMYAKQNGYDKIEGYIVKNRKDKQDIQVATKIGHNLVKKGLVR